MAQNTKIKNLNPRGILLEDIDTPKKNLTNANRRKRKSVNFPNIGENNKIILNSTNQQPKPENFQNNQIKNPVLY